MSNDTTTTSSSTCAPDDDLCTVATYRLDVIVVPTVLLLITAVTLTVMFVLAYCHRERASALPRYSSSLHRRTRHLQGIDAPLGIDPLEHEEVPMAVHKRAGGAANGRATTGGRLGTFGQVVELSQTLPVSSDESVRLYKARMDNKDVVLRVLKDSASGEERRRFLSFASFVSGLGPHPFLPVVGTVVTGPVNAPSPAPPTLMVVEEMRHRDLLGFLWRCRQPEASACNMTEKRLFTMATQVAMALEYLHSRRCVHGNVCARSILVGGDLTAKLWGLGAAHRRQTSSGAVDATELKKWQAPEVLARRDFSPSADVWSFGLLLYEMITLGEPPFAQVRTEDLLQHLQRGNDLQRPPACSSALFAVMLSCCQRSPSRRLTVAGLLEKLRVGESTANGRTHIRSAVPLDVENYLRQAGYAEAYNFAVL
ncbi:tyrosine-protein kinase STYK1-like [Hippocampus zosterae]|uniref:tyrosine-protein kinase STYK1-like n=1 Tax=Hippocampus zosterae TaxID=109293 RepID=UPI00223CA21A|nr:tyrosine-protein kinase STYK1-like [Hippocampus zosterae]XP_051927158.1 tyrosine-protein kinase STYK1-like [Hippocampus zosterae]